MRHSASKTASVFGLNAVAATLEGNVDRAIEIHISEHSGNSRIKEIVARAKSLGIPVIETTAKALDERAAGVRHQGVMAIVRQEQALREKDLDHLLDELDEAPLLLVLDGVQDPHNLGACLRTADAVGAHAVIAPKDRAVGLTPAVRKDRKSTRLNSSHTDISRMPSSA